MKDWKSIALVLGAIAAVLIYRHFNVVEAVATAEEKPAETGGNKQPADTSVIISGNAGGTGKTNASPSISGEGASHLVDPGLKIIAE